MNYLLGAILLQVWNANLLKIGESRRQRRMVVIGFNYLSATAIAAVLWAMEGGAAPAGIWAMMERAVLCVRRRWLVTQTGSAGSRRASASKVAASEQSQSKSSWP